MDINFKCISSSSSKSSEKTSQICWEQKALVRDYASVVLEENQGYYNHNLPSLSNDFFKILNTSVMVFCECLNFNRGWGLLNLVQGAHRDLHLIRPFLFWADNNYFCQKTRSKRSRGDYYIGFISHFPAPALIKLITGWGQIKPSAFNLPLALSSPFV